MRRLIAGLLMATALIGPALAKVLYHWTEVGAGDTVSVRAITVGACPGVNFDGVPVRMEIRVSPATVFRSVPAASFDVSTCETRVPAGTKIARIAGDNLPLPGTAPHRIVVFGDTGCRIAKRERVQACNDPKSWPFPEVARRAALVHPDLVIHVGDYLYREEPCPRGNTGCAGTPYGYGWDTWNVDFFNPADPLLRAAPWIFVRGNHEDCNRAAEGWMRFLDQAPVNQNCHDFSGIFVARMGSFGIVNVDGAKADDNVKNAPQAVRELRRQFAAVRQSVPSEAWLVSHRPFDAMRPDDNGRANTVENRLQSKALSDLLPSSVRMLVAGHIHFFQAVDFGGKAPPQLVVGTGGDNLSPIPAMSLAGSNINGKIVASASAYSGFAYMVWDRTPTGWTGTLFGFDGRSLDTCNLSDRRLVCDR